MLFIGCSKDENIERNSQVKKVNTRSTSSLDTAWLTDFQTYIKNIRDNNNTTNSFTLDEVAYGTETLINIKYSRYQADNNTVFHNDTLNFNTSTSDYYDLFSSSKSSIETNLQSYSNPKVVGFSLEVDTVIGNITRFTASTIISGGSTSQRIYDPCDFFDDSESLYLGLYGIDPDEPYTYLDCYDKGFGYCGGMNSQNEIEQTAVEEIQDRMNYYKPGLPLCEGGGLAEGYYNIKAEQFHTRGWDFVINPLSCTNTLTTSQDPCDCLGHNELNDLSMSLDYYISNNASLPGYDFISANLGLDILIVWPQPPVQEQPNSPHGIIYQGKPFCLKETQAEGPLLEMDVNDDK